MDSIEGHVQAPEVDDRQRNWQPEAAIDQRCMCIVLNMGGLLPGICSRVDRWKFTWLMEERNEPMQKAKYRYNSEA